MAIMVDQKPEKYAGEGKVWEALRDLLPNDEVVVYNNREIKGREYDFTLLIKDLGVLVIEVKGWNPEHVEEVIGVDEIRITSYANLQRSPKKQARGYRFNWINYFSDKYGMSPLVLDMVCYPFISEKEYKRKHLDIISAPDSTLFKEDLSDRITLGRKIMNLFQENQNISFKPFDQIIMHDVRCGLEPLLKKINENLESVSKITDYYSVLKYSKSRLTDDEIGELIEAYFAGVKCLVFVSQKEDVRRMVETIQEKMVKRKIIVDKNDLKFGIDTGTHEFNEQKELLDYRMFNFELYYVSEEQIDEEKIRIVDGLVTDRQASILKQFAQETKFNMEQYEIEHAPCNKNILVRAGAGSGKTYSMVSRIAFLYNRKEGYIIDLVQDIVMVTFTKEAADNMRKRLKQLFENYFVVTRNPKFLLQIEAVDKMQISTIHKFAKSLIQQASMKLGLGHEFSITSSNYAKEVIYDKYLNEFIERKSKENPNIVSDLRMPVYQFKKYLLSFSKQLYNKSYDIKKIKREEIGEFYDIPFFDQIIQEVIVKAEVEYEQKVAKTNKIDLQNTMMLMEKVTGKELIRSIDLNYKYLFIDEFQDTDDCQIRSFLNIQNALSHIKLFIVGDLKQSIYRFRGATTSAFAQINSDDGTWIEKNLTTNYRTDNRLLNKFDVIFSGMGKNDYLPYANGVNEDKLESNIDTTIDDSQLIQCYQYSKHDKKNFFDQLFKAIQQNKDMIADLSMKNKLSKEEKKIAILVRENWQVIEVMKEARRRGVSIETQIGGNLYQLAPAVDLCKLCLALSNSRNVVYLYNLIDSNYVSINVDITRLYGEDNAIKLAELEALLDRYFKKIMQVTWKGLIERVHKEPILKVLKDIYESTSPWCNYSQIAKEQQFYKANLELVIEKLIQNYSVDYLMLSNVLNSLKINILTSQEELARDIETEDVQGEATVICTTIHKSKGLEYGTVILPYMNQRIDSMKKADLDVMYSDHKLSYGIKLADIRTGKISKVYNSNYNQKEEQAERIKDESRVLYVALTRAIRNVIWFNDTSTEKMTWKEFMEEQYGN